MKCGPQVMDCGPLLRGGNVTYDDPLSHQIRPGTDSYMAASREDKHVNALTPGAMNQIWSRLIYIEQMVYCVLETGAVHEGWD